MRHNALSVMRVFLGFTSVIGLMSALGLMINSNEVLGCSPHTLALSLESTTPTGLETGLSQGVGIHYLYSAYSPSLPTDCQRYWTLMGGVHTSYRSLDEGSLGWHVQHDEVRLGGELALMRIMGQGGMGFSLGLQGVYLSEFQERHQAQRLLMNDREVEDSSLTYEATQILGELSLKTLARLTLIERPQSLINQVGLLSAAELAWRFPNQSLPLGVTSWGWGIQIGVYVSLGEKHSREKQEDTP